MSKRLQVLLAERELDEIRRLAKRRHITVADWVREALGAARKAEPRGDPKTKIQAVRAAAKNAFPTGDIDQMLAEIASGYAEHEAR